MEISDTVDEFNIIQKSILSYLNHHLLEVTDQQRFDIAAKLSTININDVDLINFMMTTIGAEPDVESDLEIFLIDFINSESFASLRFVVSTVEAFINAGANIADLSSLELEIEGQIQWSMGIADLTFAKFKNILSAFDAPTIDNMEINDIVNSVSRSYSVVLYQSATTDIYQECMIRFLNEQNADLANRMTLGIIAADFTSNSSGMDIGQASRILVPLLTDIATSVSADLEELRRNVLYSDEFSSILFAFEILNTLISQGASIDQLSDPVVSNAIFNTIMWNSTLDDITFQVYTDTVGAMTTFDWYILKIKNDEAAFNIIKDYAFVNVGMYCENNGLNIGSEEYLQTGICECIDNAEIRIDEMTGVTRCECVEEYTMVIDELTYASSCEQGKDLYRPLVLKNNNGTPFKKMLIVLIFFHL